MSSFSEAELAVFVTILDVLESVPKNRRTLVANLVQLHLSADAEDPETPPPRGVFATLTYISKSILEDHKQQCPS